MATQSFSFTNTGAPEYESSTITVAADKNIRVRFSTATSAATARLKLVANSVTSYYNVFQVFDEAENRQAQIFEVVEGDVVSIVATLSNDDSAVAGILEEV